MNSEERKRAMAIIGGVGFVLFWVSLYMLIQVTDPSNVYYVIFFFVSMVLFAWLSGYIAGRGSCD